jgi:4-diphosphocytidyl-2-C-methyl-D-erythritol kinase
VLTLKAHAKVNLGLHVTARRQDGYHDIDTLFVRLTLHDTLTLTKAQQGIQLQVQGANLPEDAGNLVYRAAEQYLNALPFEGGVRIQLIKEIPVAAGLGGGSSDAAAALKGLAQLYPANIELMDLAINLGSDVPFFLSDYSAARGQGRGEVLTPVSLSTCHLVLINPGVHVSAKEAYGALDTLQGALAVTEILEALRQQQTPHLYNALQPGILIQYPAIAQVLEALNGAGLAAVLMSGSGSTCFGLAPDAEAARQIAEQLQRAHSDWWVRAVTTG